MGMDYIDAEIRNATIHSKGIVSDHIEIYDNFDERNMSSRYSVVLRKNFNAHFGPECLENDLHNEPVKRFWKSYEVIGDTRRGWKQRQILGSMLPYLDGLILAMQIGEEHSIPVYSSVEGENRVIWHPQDWTPIYERGCRNQKPYSFVETHCDGDL